MKETKSEDLVFRLRKRAEIRRQIQTRKSVQEGKPDRIAELLDEAAKRIEDLEDQATSAAYRHRDDMDRARMYDSDPTRGTESPDRDDPELDLGDPDPTL